MNVLHSQTEFVFKKPLHPKLNSEQSLHEVIAGTGECSLSSRTSDCCLGWQWANDTLWGGFSAECLNPAWSLLFNSIKNISCHHYIQKTVLCDHFCRNEFYWLFISIFSVSNMVSFASGAIWGGIWSEQLPKPGFSSNNWKQSLGLVTAGAACRNLQGSPGFGTGDLLVQLVKYSAMKVARSSASSFAVSSQSCAGASLGTSWMTQEINLLSAAAQA